METGDDNPTILRPPPVYGGGARPAARAACGPGELAAIALDEWPAPDGGAFGTATAARIRQRVLEHVALHAQPTYRFLGMLEAASGGRLRMRDLVHVERGALAKAVRAAPPAAAPPVGPGSGGGGGYSMDAVLELVAQVLEIVKGNAASADEVHAQLRADLSELRRDLEALASSEARQTVSALQASYDLLQERARELREKLGADEAAYLEVNTELERDLEAVKAELAQTKKELAFLQRVRTQAESGTTGVPPVRPSLKDLSRDPFDLDDDETADESAVDALIGGAVGARNRALRDAVTVHLLLTPFALGLLELARDEVSEMAGRGARPLRLCALMHSFTSGVASHFAKYAAQVWERQGAPPPFAPGADANTVVQPRKTRFNYAAEAGLVAAARDYFGRLRERADGSLEPAYHGPTLDVRALPDGVYAAHPELAAALPAYRRGRIARTQLALDALGLGAGGTVRRRARQSPGYAPYAPVRRVAAERTVGGSTGRFAPLRFAAPQWG